MGIKVLDVVALTQDMPQHGLKRGDVGTVVEVCPPDGVMVEFVTREGRTRALVALGMGGVRPIGPPDTAAAG